MAEGEGGMDMLAADAGTAGADQTEVKDTPDAGLGVDPAGENKDTGLAEKPGEGDKPAEGDGKEKDNKGEGAPEKYEFKLPDDSPEGMALDEKAMEAFEPLARELGLTNDQANKLVGLQAQVVARQAQEFTEGLNKQWLSTRNEWFQALKTDKEIGGDNFEAKVEKANAFLRQFGTPELFKAFKEYGWGVHPELVRVFARAGEATGEDTLERGSPSGGGSAKSTAQVLYPNMSSGS